MKRNFTDLSVVITNRVIWVLTVWEILIFPTPSIVHYLQVMKQHLVVIIVTVSLSSCISTTVLNNTDTVHDWSATANTLQVYISTTRLATPVNNLHDGTELAWENLVPGFTHRLNSAKYLNWTRPHGTFATVSQHQTLTWEERVWWLAIATWSCSNWHQSDCSFSSLP